MSCTSAVSLVHQHKEGGWDCAAQAREGTARHSTWGEVALRFCPASLRKDKGQMASVELGVRQESWGREKVLL